MGEQDGAQGDNMELRTVNNYCDTRNTKILIEGSGDE